MYKKTKYTDSCKKQIFLLSLIFSLSLYTTGCSEKQTETNISENNIEVSSSHIDSAVAAESAKDTQVDFSLLQAENPNIFAWIYIPDTAIDYPVLQHSQTDDFYASHNVYGEESSDGAVYIELANLTEMTDFNTVLHGNVGNDGSGPFADLYQFADPDFFEEHEHIYLYLDGNVLTYEIFAAYERNNTSLIRDYNFTYLAGGQQFLDDLYNTRDMNKNLRDGWSFVTPYHFLLTLTTQQEENAEKQFIVVAVLTHDAAGTIDRIINE